MQWTACLSLYVQETGRLKVPGGTPYNGLIRGQLRTASARKGNLYREKWYIKG